MGHSIKYRELLEKIVKTGDGVGENFLEVSISPKAEVRVEKYNERIKDKLFQTGLNTM